MQIWASGNVKLHTPTMDDLTKAIQTLVPMLELFRTDSTAAFLARRKTAHGLPMLRAKMGELSSSSSSSSSSDDEADDEADRDPLAAAARANKRKRRLFAKTHLDRLWDKWARLGKHGFINDDDDSEDDDDNDDGDDDVDDSDGGAHENKMSKRRKSNDTRSYAALDSEDEGFG